MTEIHARDLIDALVDGVAVDPGDLVRALAQQDDREYFADLLVLRRLTRGPRAAAVPAPAAVRPQNPARLPRRVWAIAAAITMLAATGGYFGGQRATRAGDASRAAAVSDAAPPPTAVVHLTRGVDWDERFGGR